MKKRVEMRILIALELRSYREVIGSALQALRPHLEVVIVEPEKLGLEVSRLDPELVICSQPNTFTTHGRPDWVEYHPYDEWEEIWVGGQRSELANLKLGDLLSIIDQSEQLYRTERN